MSSSRATVSSKLAPYPLGGGGLDGFGGLHGSVVGFEGLLLFVKRVYSSRSHLYKGRRVGMQAATTPNKTSHVRRYQFGRLSPFWRRQLGGIFPICLQRGHTSWVVCYILIVEDGPDERQ